MKFNFPKKSKYRKFYNNLLNLAESMSGYSEYIFCVGWLIGNEYAIWKIITESNEKILDRNKYRYLENIADYANETGYWIIFACIEAEKLSKKYGFKYHVISHSYCPVPLEVWEKIYNDREKNKNDNSKFHN